MINLVPQAYIKQNKKKKYSRIIWGAIVLQLLSFILVIGILSTQLRRQGEEIVNLQAQIEDTKYNKVIEADEDLQVLTATYSQWEQLLLTLEQPSFVSGASLDMLLANLPMGVTIATLDMDSKLNTITLTGVGVEIYSVMRYVEQLQNIYPSAIVTFEVEEAVHNAKYYSYMIVIEFEEVS